MERLDQLERRIDDALAHYEQHKAAFETLSQKLASYNGIRAEVLEEVKGWIAELRTSGNTDETADSKAQPDTDYEALSEDSDAEESKSDNQDKSE